MPLSRSFLARADAGPVKKNWERCG